jgi:hypothetical protein
VAALKTDIERAYDALAEKKARYDVLFAYYDGNHPLVYSTEHLSDLFRKIEARWVQNWCSVVVDSALERLTFKGFEVDKRAGGSAAASDKLTELGSATDLEIEFYDAHKDALITGEGFLLAWPDEEGGFDLYANDPRLVHCFYETERPKDIEFAAKWWRAGGATLMNLYYPDRIEHWMGPKNPRSGKSFVPREKGTTDDRGEEVEAEASEDNPYGRVPVFHLRTSRRGPGGELRKLISAQDAVNKLLADMMVASEFGSFPQRYIITEQDTSKLKIGPGQLWAFRPADEGVQPTSAGTFPPVDVDRYLGAMDKLASSIAIVSRTPKHYFFAQGGDPSGEALIAMEAPLVKKCEHYSELFGQVWRELGVFMLEALGVKVDPGAVSATWDAMQTQQPISTTTALVNYVKATMPLVTALRELGWGPDELQQMEDDKASEPTPPTFTSAMQGFNQGVPGAYPSPPGPTPSPAATPGTPQPKGA